jgi:hypothetical protein
MADAAARGSPRPASGAPPRLRVFPESLFFDAIVSSINALEKDSCSNAGFNGKERKPLPRLKT